MTILLTWGIGVSLLSWEFRKLTWLLLNFVIIDGSFTYDQLHIGQARMEISKRMKRFLKEDVSEVKMEADR